RVRVRLDGVLRRSGLLPDGGPDAAGSRCLPLDVRLLRVRTARGTAPALPDRAHPERHLRTIALPLCHAPRARRQLIGGGLLAGAHRGWTKITNPGYRRRDSETAQMRRSRERRALVPSACTAVCLTRGLSAVGSPWGQLSRREEQMPKIVAT